MKIRSKVENIRTDVITLNWKFRKKKTEAKWQERDCLQCSLPNDKSITKGQGYLYVTGRNRS
jgi:hypothetical protein